MSFQTPYTSDELRTGMIAEFTLGGVVELTEINKKAIKNKDPIITLVWEYLDSRKTQPSHQLHHFNNLIGWGRLKIISMGDNKIKLEQALKRYRQNGGKLTDEEISINVLKDKTPKRAAQIFSLWKNGKVDLAQLKPEHVRSICEILHTTPNDLYGYE